MRDRDVEISSNFEGGGPSLRCLVCTTIDSHHNGTFLPNFLQVFWQEYAKKNLGKWGGITIIMV